MAYSQSEQIDEFGQVMAPDYLAYTDGTRRPPMAPRYIASGPKRSTPAWP